MTDNPIYDNIKNNDETPIFANVEKPEPILGPITGDNKTPKSPWQNRIAILKNKTFRKWAYGISAAAISLVFTLIGRPEFIPMVSPLIIAILYVDPKGKPIEDA